LRDLGFDKRSLEGLIHEEINSLLIEVGRMAGPDWEELVELHDVLGTSGVNILWNVMAGVIFSPPHFTIDKINIMLRFITWSNSLSHTIHDKA
jgi:hypothetical protein